MGFCKRNIVYLPTLLSFKALQHDVIFFIVCFLSKASTTSIGIYYNSLTSERSSIAMVYPWGKLFPNMPFIWTLIIHTCISLRIRQKFSWSSLHIYINVPSYQRYLSLARIYMYVVLAHTTNLGSRTARFTSIFSIRTNIEQNVNFSCWV